MKIILLFVIATCSLDLFAETLDRKIDSIFKAQIGFVERNDYKGFISNGSAEFKKITLSDFNKVEQQLLGRFKTGHVETFLTTLSQDGYLVYLWKITFKDKRNDVLAKMIIGKDDKILGFWLQ